MAVNKVIYNNNTLIDLTGDTVIPEALRRGYTAHMADGSLINGENGNIENYPDEVRYLDELQDYDQEIIFDNSGVIIWGTIVYRKV